ncbi:hypothetical protein HDC92_005081 [Pedobacter sp. AK017]|uniref:hypothetical protein n=1 Tax=Pedobacter sp. AK017 TaxID=2723073 RepID=UPI00161A0F04|nr:hypothetical protein [Pedobacter sp. AK017]MBB5441373.1 hypothetical protein [Pedobacter sp. AK017]
MKLKLTLPGENPVKDLINLNNFIEKSGIEGISHTGLTESENKDPRHMGIGDFLGSISTVIDAAEKPLVELVKCLQLYVSNYRTKITIPTKNGNIEIDGGRKYSAQEIKDIVGEILDKVKE